MTIIEPTSIAPRGGRDVQYLPVPTVHRLRRAVRRQTLRVPDQRMPNLDLEEWVDFLLATGCRDGEALATRWRDVDLTSDPPVLRVCGTLLEPRTGYVAKLCRQDATKSRSERTLLLPGRAVDVVTARRARSDFTAPGDPVSPRARARGSRRPTSGRACARPSSKTRSLQEPRRIRCAEASGP